MKSLAFLLVALSTANALSRWNVSSPDNLLRIEWNITATRFEAEINCYFQVGWCSWGINDLPQMQGSDIVWIYMNSSNVIMVTDAKATLRSRPVVDPSQDLTIHSADILSTGVVVRYSRLLNTGDADRDVVIRTDGTQQYLLYAHNMVDAATGYTTLARHKVRGFDIVTFNSSLEIITPTPSPTPTPTPTPTNTPSTPTPTPTPTPSPYPTPTPILSGFYMSPDGMMSIKWGLTETTVYLEMRTNFTVGWFAWGVNSNYPQMKFSDLFWIKVDPAGEIMVVDAYAPDYRNPDTSEAQDITTLLTYVTDDHVFLQLSRPINTGDDESDVIWSTDGSTQYLVFASNQGDTGADWADLSQHTVNGNVPVVFGTLSTGPSSSGSDLGFSLVVMLCALVLSVVYMNNRA